jgi:hypothetical protein
MHETNPCGCDVLKIGDWFTELGSEYVVLAVQYYEVAGGESRGFVLGFAPDIHEYRVWEIDENGVRISRRRTNIEDNALNDYAVLSVTALYTARNRMAPKLTFGHVTDRDVL